MPFPLLLSKQWKRYLRESRLQIINSALTLCKPRCCLQLFTDGDVCARNKLCCCKVAARLRCVNLPHKLNLRFSLYISLGPLSLRRFCKDAEALAAALWGNVDMFMYFWFIYIYMYTLVHMYCVFHLFQILPKNCNLCSDYSTLVQLTVFCFFTFWALRSRCELPACCTSNKITQPFWG